MRIHECLKIIILAAILIISVWSDLLKGRLGNPVAVAAVATGFALNAAAVALFAGGAGAPWFANPLLDAFVGFLIPFALLFLLFYIRALGAGDIKLFMAIGSLMGARFVLLTILYAFAAGGALAFLAAIAKRTFVSGFRDLWTYLYICVAHGKLFKYNGEFSARAAGAVRFTPAILIGAAVSAYLIYT